MALLLFIVLVLFISATLFIPRRLFKFYILNIVAMSGLLLFWALTLEKNGDGSHIYGLFLVITFIVINALLIGIRYIILRRTPIKAEK